MSAPPFDAGLRDYAARLLVGTGLDLDHAHRIASGQTPATGSVDASLRDGWGSTDDPNASASGEGAAS